ncbi:MAG: Lrp/AsnC family transcriptional regulator [Candidatus Bathyarchaeota archaeon]|nr:Lrp/AsnC family transcriptional regulator [Candidatus Bathyarchaeota archaeon]
MDVKIIKELLKDGRKNFSEIAEALEISDSMIWKRFKELEDAGIIVGSSIQLYYPSIGYNIVGNITFKIEPHLADRTVKYVQKMPNIHSAWLTVGKSQVNAVATMEQIEGLENLKERIRKIPSVSDIRTYIWIGIRNIRENLAIVPTKKMPSKDNVEKNGYVTLYKSEGTKQVDQTDRCIIEKLSADGRVSFRKLAKEIGVSTDTIARRYRKLKEKGIVKVSIQLDTAKLGYHGLATFYLAFGSQSDVISVVEKICTIPDIVLIVQTSGNFDLLVEAMIKDVDQLLSIQDQLTDMPGVTKTEMHIIRPIPIFPVFREYISTF